MKSFMSRFISVVCLQERDLATARFSVWRADNVRNVCNEIELRAPQKRVIKKQKATTKTRQKHAISTLEYSAHKIYIYLVNIAITYISTELTIHSFSTFSSIFAHCQRAEQMAFLLIAKKCSIIPKNLFEGRSNAFVYNIFDTFILM